MRSGAELAPRRLIETRAERLNSFLFFGLGLKALVLTGFRSYGLGLRV